MTNDWSDIEEEANKALGGCSSAYQNFLKLIYERLRPRMRRVLPPSLIDDCLQETLLAVHKSLHTLDTNKKIKPWIHAIAFHKIQDQLRSLYKTKELETFIDDVAHSHEDLENSIYVEKLLLCLNTREQEIIRLMKIEELSVVEVSQRLSLSEANVKVICFRSINKLRAMRVREEFS